MLSTRPRHLEGLESGRFADVQSGAALLEGNPPKPPRRTILAIPPPNKRLLLGRFCSAETPNAPPAARAGDGSGLGSPIPSCASLSCSPIPP